MRVFHCTHCQHLVFFENSECVECKHKLAYLPDLDVIGAFTPAEGNTWRCVRSNEERTYRLCDNYVRENVCNWAIPVGEPHSLCESCRFTQLVPNLSEPGNKEAWYKLELAKRRLLYTLRRLGCGVRSKIDAPDTGLAFAFLAETDGTDSVPVLTGHNNGLITINIAEADTVERERRREHLREAYRTLLGHFRHEVGHYYWDRLIKDTPTINAFRESFGDERKDYAQALRDHYVQGPPQDWPNSYVSAYATAHPWEDWAETWAHYLHMIDTLETAVECGLSLQPRRPDEPRMIPAPDLKNRNAESFDNLIKGWFSLTYVLNNLNRGLGLPDAYPFVLSTPAIDKLHLVHVTIAANSKDSKSNQLRIR